MSGKNKVIVLAKIFILILIGFNMQAINYYPFFYQPRIFFGEPRLARSWLTSIDINVRGGHALNGFDGNGNQVNALAIYGCENLHVITQNVPQEILDCNEECLLNNLWRHESNSLCFGKLAITGKCSAMEFLPVITQNFANGFFASLSIPIKKVSIKDLFFNDLTPRESLAPDIAFMPWQTTMNNIEYNMCRYGVYLGPSKNKGLGDIQLLGGWTFNYEDTTTVDYIDFTLAAGINIPTSHIASSNAPWCLPLGYEGHIGIPLVVTASSGIFDWLTVGVQTGALWFNTKQRIVSIKTACDQQGWISLVRASARVKKGTNWHIDEYLKLDHLIGGFSLVLGFAHDHANQTRFANSTQRELPWTMTAFNFMLECDFATFKHPNAPRLAFTIDKVIHGKRIMDTALFGSYLGVDFEW